MGDLGPITIRVQSIVGRKTRRRIDAAGGVQVHVEGQPELLEVVGTMHAIGRLADLLYGRQEQGDQDGDDGNDNQELDEGEPAALARN